MNLALVDDMEYDLRNLQNLIIEYFSNRDTKFRVSLFSSGEQFIDAFGPQTFDVIFLDNLLGGINGMDVARRVRTMDRDVPIVFITTEESYALEGYEVQAMDYILKPVKKERLYKVMDRLNKTAGSRNVIEIKENRMTRQLYLDDILYVRSSGHFLEIQTSMGSLKPYMTMEYFQSMLRGLGEYGDTALGLRFQNCCRGYVVCLDHVRSLDASDFLMSDGSRIPISRPRYKEMQTAYANYLFRHTRDIVE